MEEDDAEVWPAMVDSALNAVAVHCGLTLLISFEIIEPWTATLTV
jgi:hypothetical protein